MQWMSSTTSLAGFAETKKVSRSTLVRWFRPFWFIPVPHNVDEHRLYDQILIDGTYFGKGNNKHCLLIASTPTHVIAWHWCKQETTDDYIALLSRINAPAMVITDGHYSARKAIKHCWPEAKIQRCLVHVQRNIRTHITARPRTTPGWALRKLSLDLTNITTLDQARAWMVNVHHFGHVYKDFINARTNRKDVARTGDIPKHAKKNAQWWYTHIGVRRGYNLLMRLIQDDQLFWHLQLTPHEGNPMRSTTNALEGAFNSWLKHHARCHRGQPAEHQRTMIDWWLHLKTHKPDDPKRIARSCNYGQDQLTKVKDLIAEQNEQPEDTGQPALYDKAIPDQHEDGISLRKGRMR